MKHMDDVTLIDRVKQGDEEAFGELYQRFHKLAFYFARKLCVNEADANDAVQDAFIEIHRSIHTLKENSYFKAWLYKIVNSKCKKIFRKNKFTTTDFEQEPILNGIVETRVEYNPDASIHFANDQEVLLHFIDELPIVHKSIILLFYLEQFSINEIADILEIPVGTVKSRLSYGRNYLKEALEEYHKKEGIKVSFKQLDAMLLSTIAMETGGFIVPLKSTHPFQLTKWIPKSLGMQILVGSMAIAGVSASAYAYHRSQDEIVLPKEAIVNEEKPNHTFQPMQISGASMNSPQDAYFTLTTWVCCEEMLKQKSIEEVLEKEQIYLELKADGGVYYQQLKQAEWFNTFENIIKNAKK